MRLVGWGSGNDGWEGDEGDEDLMVGRRSSLGIEKTLINNRVVQMW